MRTHNSHTRLLASCFFALALSSCYEDLGNYDYHEVDEIRIDTAGTGILPNYAITRFDSLTLKPNVYLNGQLVTDADSTALSYQWTIYSAVAGAGTSLETDTIGHERHLNAQINRTGGSYYVQLTVTNRSNGLQQYFRTNIAVGEALDGGWMAIYERSDRPHSSDLALIINPWTKSYATSSRVYVNLYELTNATYLPGSPIRCMDIAVSLAGHNIVGLCTDSTLVGVSDSGIEQVMGFNNFFNTAPSKQAPIWYSHHGNGGISGQNSEILINDNRVYTNTYFNSTTGERESRFGIAKYGDNIGELAAWNAELAAPLNYGVVVYDQTNKRFLYSAFDAAQLEPLAAQDTNTVAFDVNHTGMTLLMGDWGTGSDRLLPYDYLLMSDGTKQWLAVANFSSSAPDDTAIGVGLYNMSQLCPNVAEATSIAASNVGSYIYYAAGNTLYNFAYDSGLPAEVAWQSGSEAEVITCVRLTKYYNAFYATNIMPSADNVVHIATWNEATREGHIYQYRINAASGELDTSASYTYSIPGKVKDMAWKYTI